VLGIGKHVQVSIDLFEGIGQKEDPDADEKKTTYDRNGPHISFDLLKS
jgi:hypothetical protein